MWSADTASSRGRPPEGDAVRTMSSVLFTVGIVISATVGFLHFFAPYAFQWYSYIPDAPAEIYASVDYVNFFFSLQRMGLSVIVLLFKRRLFAGSREALVVYCFLVTTWLCRVLVTVIVPWPTALQSWLLVGFLTEFVIVLVPAVYLVQRAVGRHPESSRQRRAHQEASTVPARK